MASTAGVDIFQSPYTPADLYIMSTEKETLEWDRTCRIVEMIYNTNAKEAMRFNLFHPYRKSGPKPKANVDIVSSKEFKKVMEGRSDGNKGRGGSRRGKSRH
jgi:hypothetical protein